MTIHYFLTKRIFSVQLIHPKRSKLFITKSSYRTKMILSIRIPTGNTFHKARRGRKKETDPFQSLKIKIMKTLNSILFSLGKSKCSTISKTGSNKKGNRFPKIENVSSKTFYKNSHKIVKMITQSTTNKKFTFSKKYLNITKSGHKKNSILINF